MNIVETINLNKQYGKSSNIVYALKNVNFTVKRGEMISVIGKSGSGKTTLLHMLAGLDQATSGKIIINEEEITVLNQERLTLFRRKNIGFVFQNYNLISILNVYDNIVLPIELSKEAIDKEFMNKIIDVLGLKDKLRAFPEQLSGGQQQRVAIARALITKPAILLADEPTGNLDTATAEDVLRLIKICNYEFQQTVIMITHNQEVAQCAGRVVSIEDGKLTEKDG